MEAKSIKNDLFEIKQKFLRVIPHPKIISKYIKELEKKGAIAEKTDLNVKGIKLFEEEIAMDLINYLEIYIATELKMKHKISVASNYLVLRNDLASLYIHQVLFLRKLNSYCTDLTNSSFEVKQSDPIDAYACLTVIKKEEIADSGINAYLCKVVKTDPKSNNNPLLRACLIANKIITHYG